MKVLMVNKFHYMKGGSETYYFTLKRMLEEDGHTVIDFSMKDPSNIPSPYERYFIENISYMGKKGVLDGLKVAGNIIYSFEAKRKFESLVKNERPDLVHLHVFQHQISPSILDVIKKYEIPTVYTAHDLKMICLNYKMMHHKIICEECKDGRYYHCAQNRCVKNSFLKSCINVIEGYFHKWRKSYDAINYIITPSEFYRTKFIEFGVKSDRVIHIPNFLYKEKPNIDLIKDSKKYYLFFGRLSEEKGVSTLIHAVENTDLQLNIVGTGPMKTELESYIGSNRINNIHLLGFMNGQELSDIVGNAKAVILPSEWYENGPYSAIEALQLGRPIIGANIGGIPELIDKNGFLFESGNKISLKEQLLKMESLAADEYQRMEQESLKIFEKNYTKKIHRERLYEVYSKVL